MKALKLLAFMALALMAVHSHARAAAPPLTVVLASGDTLRADRVLPSGVGMVRVEGPAGVSYFQSVRIRSIRDSSGRDLTREALERRRVLDASTVLTELYPDETTDQSPTSKHAHKHHALCWRGHPPPECRSFLITETGLLTRLDDYPFTDSESRVAITFDLGWMKNLDERAALGFSGHVLTSDPVQRLGVQVRYRRWLGRSTSIDITPGVYLGGEDEIIDYDPPGFVLGAAINAGDLITLTAEAEYARYQDYGTTLPQIPRSRSDVAWRAGAKLGSGLGLVSAVALVGLVIAIAASGGFE